MPSPPPPRPAARSGGWVRGLFRLRPTGWAWTDAVRAGACVGGVVAIGWWAGDVEAGLTASIGTLTVVYGAGRPYAQRARQLAVIALALTAVVVLGTWSEAFGWVSVLVVATVAVGATWLCQALDTGPPGPYMFVLAAATATSLPATGEPWQTGLLVLAGGALAWLAHMAGYLIRPHGPETAALAAAAAAVRGMVDAIGTDRYVHARDRAAGAMHQCWLQLSSGGRTSDPHDVHPRLRSTALALHVLLADGMRANDIGGTVDADTVRQLRRIEEQVPEPPPAPRPLGREDIPSARPTPFRAAAELLAAGSLWRIVVLRVGIAALVAGALGALLGLDHAYWATAAAVLVLCQGLNWLDTLERAVQRLAGTWIGLSLAAAVLAARPAGALLVLAVAVLQAVVQLTVPRNYGLGVVFITPLALTIGTAGQPVDVTALVLARGVDTAVGCVVGLLTFLAVAPDRFLPQPQRAIVEALRAVTRVLPHLADGTTTSPEARAERRTLNRLVLDLPGVYTTGTGALTRRQRTTSARWWAALAASQQLAYRTLAECWLQDGTRPTAGSDGAVTHDEARRLAAELDDLATAIDSGATLASEDPSEPGGRFLAAELHVLRVAVPPNGPA